MLTRITLTFALLLLVRPVSAQETSDEDRGVLAGPKLSEQEADGRGPTFSGDQRRDRRAFMPPRQWLAIYQDLEMAPEQRPLMMVVLSEWSRDVKLFAKRMGKEDRELQLKFQAARSGRGPALTDAEQERLKEFADLKPTFEPYQNRLWEILTPEQQAEFQRLHELEREKERQREVRRRERRQGDGPARRGAPDADRDMAPDEMGAPEMPPQDQEYDQAARRRLEFLRRLRKPDAAPG